MEKNEKSKSNNEPTFRTIRDNIRGQIWRGRFYKVNVCGAYKVEIKTRNNLPCNSEFNQCVSFDKGSCVEIIKKTKYTILKDEK